MSYLHILYLFSSVKGINFNMMGHMEDSVHDDHIFNYNLGSIHTSLPYLYVNYSLLDSPKHSSSTTANSLKRWRTDSSSTNNNTTQTFNNINQEKKFNSSFQHIFTSPSKEKNNSMRNTRQNTTMGISSSAMGGGMNNSTTTANYPSNSSVASSRGSLHHLHDGNQFLSNLAHAHGTGTVTFIAFCTVYVSFRFVQFSFCFMEC